MDRTIGGQEQRSEDWSDNFSKKIWYGGEEGLLHGIIKEDTTDVEGKWIGVIVAGTQVHQLRSFLINGLRSHPLFVNRGMSCRAEGEHSGYRLLYLLSYREVTPADRLPWVDIIVKTRSLPSTRRKIFRKGHGKQVWPIPG